MKQETIDELMAVFNRVKEQEPENHIMVFYGDSDREFSTIKSSMEGLVAALITAANGNKAVQKGISLANMGIKELEEHPELYTNTQDNEK